MPAISPETSAALAWLQGNDTGLSSRALVYAALDERSTSRDYPHDPGDLARCLRMLRCLPWARDGITRLAARCPVWAAYAARWDELEALLSEEVRPPWTEGRAPRTYRLMQQLRDLGERDRIAAKKEDKPDA